MSRKTKIILKVSGAALLLLTVVAAFVPLYEARSQYCLYCGNLSLSVRILGVPVPYSKAGRSIYRDSVVIPSHAHRMTESNGSTIWAFRGQQFRDEFGWTGRLYRDALVAGVVRTPEREKEIVAEYLGLDPGDHEGAQRFLDAYGEKEPAQGDTSSGETHAPQPDSVVDGRAWTLAQFSDFFAEDITIQKVKKTFGANPLIKSDGDNVTLVYAVGSDRMYEPGLRIHTIRIHFHDEVFLNVEIEFANISD